MKKIILLIGLFMISSIVHLNAYTVEKNMEKLNESEISKQFTPKESFTQNGVQYTLYSDLTAEFDKSEQNILKKKKSDVLVRKDLRVYKNEVNFKSNDINDNLKTKKYRVVFNNSSGQFVPLSGNIIVKSKSKLDEINQIVTIVKEYKILENYIYIAKLPDDILISETVKKITAMGASVEEVKVEVLENLNEPQ